MFYCPQVAKKEQIQLIQSDKKKLFFFFDRQEQCNVLAELTREYQMLKSAIGSVMESAEPLYDISSVLKDHEETKRCLSKV